MKPGFIGTLIGLGFAVVWLWLGANALGGDVGKIVGAAGSVLIVAAGFWLAMPNGRQPAQAQGFKGGVYLLAVLFEVVAGNVAINVLNAHHRIDLIWPVFGAIVGLHFIGLWWAMGLRKFLALSVVMTAINLAVVFAPLDPDVRIMSSGFGSAAALVVTALA